MEGKWLMHYSLRRKIMSLAEGENDFDCKKHHSVLPLVSLCGEVT
jgi:hypothetical protein